MPATLKWQQIWSQPETTPLLLYLQTWTDTFPLGDVTLAATGHATVTGDLVTYSPFDLGSVTLGTTGHSFLATAGVSYPIEDVLAIAGSYAMVGHSSISGNLDFEEPFFVDPPLELDPVAYASVAGDFLLLISKSIGTGQIGASAKTGFAPTAITYQIGITKPLLAVSLAGSGHVIISGDLVATTVKEIGSGVMAATGRSTVAQTGFTIDAPEPFTHPIGTGLFPLVAASTLAGDVLVDLTPPHDIGAATMSVSGHSALSVLSLFAGGPYPLLSVSLGMAGKTMLSMGISYPGAEEVSTEIFAIYEGVEMQEASATLEGGPISAG